MLWWLYCRLYLPLWPEHSKSCPDTASQCTGTLDTTQLAVCFVAVCSLNPTVYVNLGGHRGSCHWGPAQWGSTTHWAYYYKGRCWARLAVDCRPTALATTGVACQAAYHNNLLDNFIISTLRSIKWTRPGIISTATRPVNCCVVLCCVWPYFLNKYFPTDHNGQVLGGGLWSQVELICFLCTWGLHPGLELALCLGLHLGLELALCLGLHLGLELALCLGLHLGLELALHLGLHPGLELQAGELHNHITYIHPITGDPSIDIQPIAGDPLVDIQPITGDPSVDIQSLHVTPQATPCLLQGDPLVDIQPITGDPLGRHPAYYQVTPW